MLEQQNCLREKVFENRMISAQKASEEQMKTEIKTEEEAEEQLLKQLSTV